MADYIASYREKGPPKYYNKKNEGGRIRSNESTSISITVGDKTHRQLRPRHIQLIGIGRIIGTALYVQI